MTKELSEEARAHYEEVLAIFEQERQAAEDRLISWDAKTEDYYLLKCCEGIIWECRWVLGKKCAGDPSASHLTD